MFLTSVRDTGTRDKNGIVVATENGEQYMEGAIERTVNATRPGGALHRIIEVVGVITDDIERDMHGSDYPLEPKFGKPWIYPLDLVLPNGSSLMVHTHHCRSDFRQQSLDAITARRERKFDFERRISILMKFLGADILISDHYMARIEYLITDAFGLFGRVLNINPAVTVEGHPYCFRGKTPTADAIERAKSGASTMTGATLHFIDTEIDHGPAIAYTAPTPVYATDERQWLRLRNYQAAKLPLIVAGLRHYAMYIYPYIGVLNVNALTARIAA